jgi:hypothetical protein
MSIDALQYRIRQNLTREYRLERLSRLMIIAALTAFIVYFVFGG